MIKTEKLKYALIIQIRGDLMKSNQPSLECIQFLELVAPYIRKSIGKTFVFKMGGEVIGQTLDSLAHEMAILYKLGIRMVVVHGGGSQISDYSKEIGIEPEFDSGLRITNQETLEQAVRPVMRELNSNVVEALNRYELEAVGLQRTDKSDLILARKAPPRMVGRRQIDLGLVGEVADVKTYVLEALVNQGYIPVISSLGMDPEGVIYNINADAVAGGIAEKIKADKLVILTDVMGVYRHPDRRHSDLVSYMDTDEARSMMQRKGVVTKGMLPKLRTCIHAVENGVARAHIVKGTDPYGLIGEVFGAGTGTMVVSPREKKVYERERVNYQ